MHDFALFDYLTYINFAKFMKFEKNIHILVSEDKAKDIFRTIKPS